MVTRRIGIVSKGSLLVAVLLAGLRLALPGTACGDGPAPCSHAFGGNLAAWQATYWYASYGVLPVATDDNGNSVVDHVALLALPPADGDGTPASIDITLRAGQPFFLPLWSLLGNSYSDGTPSDPTVDVDVFRTLDIRVTVDGTTVINNANVMDYYSAGDFDPVIPFDFPPADAYIWFQAIGMTHAPPGAGTTHDDP
jgi:hypothetical protein